MEPLVEEEESASVSEGRHFDVTENDEEVMGDWEDNDSERSPFIEQRDASGSEGTSIKRRIGLIHAIAMIVGGIIGSGIFISPRYVLGNAGSIGETLLVWTFGGVLSLLGALCYCELGTFIEKSGGEYIYLKIAYGRFIGFLYSWVNVWFLDPGSHAILSLTFAVYATQPFFSQSRSSSLPPTFRIGQTSGSLCNLHLDSHELHKHPLSCPCTSVVHRLQTSSNC